MEPLFRHLLILIAALLPTYLIRFTVFGIPATLLEVVIWTAALIGLTQPAVRRSWRTAWQKLPKFFLFFVLIFITSAVISTIISPHPLTSLGILKGWIVTPVIYAFMVYAAGLEIGNW